MQQFLVPQFIDVEDKIIGPITTRQFVMLLVAMFLGFIEFKLLSFSYFLLAVIITTTIICMFAFLKVNGRPLHFFVLNFIQTLKRPRLRVWSRLSYVYNANLVESEIIQEVKKENKKAPISGSRLRDLSLVVNTGGVYESEFGNETPAFLRKL